MNFFLYIFYEIYGLGFHPEHIGYQDNKIFLLFKLITFANTNVNVLLKNENVENAG